jgi:hypothetical protein
VGRRIMAKGIVVTAEQFSHLVAAGGVLRDLAKSYPTDYESKSSVFDERILRSVREDFLDNR